MKYLIFFLFIVSITAFSNFAYAEQFGNINDQQYVRAFANVNAGADCSSPTGYGKDSTESFAPFLPASAGASSCNYFAVIFDISDLPENADVTDSIMVYDQATATNTVNCDVVQMSVDITTATAQQIYEDIVSPAATFVANNAFCTTTGTGKTLDLGATFDTILETNLGTSVEFGIKFTSDSRDVANRQADISNVRLLVTYNIPPDPPKQFAGSVDATHGINTSWSQGASNGDTHQDYTFQRLNLDGVTWDTLTTTTGTSYQDGQPQRNDTAKYRIRDNGLLGYDCYQFLINSTITTDIQSYFPYCFTTNDNGPLGNDGVVTGNTLYTNSSGIIARYLDGSSFDVLPTETDYDYDRTQPMSIGYDLETSTAGVMGVVVKRNQAGSGVTGWETRIGATGFPLFRISNTTNSINVSYNTAVTDGVRHTHLWTYDGSSTAAGVNFYLDGVPKSLTVNDDSFSSGSSLNNIPVTIGTFYNGGAGQNNLTGSIRNVLIADRELDANEAEQWYLERIDTSTLAMYPDAVTDLTGTSDVSLSTVNLSWSEPFVFGGVDGYQINYTSPFGDPITVLTNNTGNDAVTAQILGLVIGEDYSFRVSPWNFLGTNGSGNIFNTTTSTSYQVGNFSSIDITNEDDFSIFFSRTDISDSDVFVNVTYPNTYNLTCAMYYQFARQNDTYSNLASTTVDTDNVMSSFEFINATGDIITITCADVNTGDSANYVLTITQFEFLDQIANLKNGTYGTYFKIGAIDGITLSVIFLAMIGFNRTNPIAGIMFLIITVTALSFFGIITYPVIMYPALALIALWAFISTRKDD